VSPWHGIPGMAPWKSGRAFWSRRSTTRRPVWQRQGPRPGVLQRHQSCSERDSALPTTMARQNLPRRSIVRPASSADSPRSNQIPGQSWGPLFCPPVPGGLKQRASQNRPGKACRTWGGCRRCRLSDSNRSGHGRRPSSRPGTPEHTRRLIRCAGNDDDLSVVGCGHSSRHAMSRWVISFSL
jgi:hypothetical protein